MRIFLVILVEEDLPAAVEFFQGMDLGDFDLGNEAVDDLVKFFDFALTFALAGPGSEEPDAKPGAAPDQLGGDEFLPIIRTIPMSG